MFSYAKTAANHNIDQMNCARFVQTNLAKSFKVLGNEASLPKTFAQEAYLPENDLRSEGPSLRKTFAPKDNLSLGQNTAQKTHGSESPSLKKAIAQKDHR